MTADTVSVGENEHLIVGEEIEDCAFKLRACPTTHRKTLFLEPAVSLGCVGNKKVSFSEASRRPDAVAGHRCLHRCLPHSLRRFCGRL